MGHGLADRVKRNEVLLYICIAIIVFLTCIVMHSDNVYIKYLRAENETLSKKATDELNNQLRQIKEIRHELKKLDNVMPSSFKGRK